MSHKITILVVGVEGIGKHCLAKALQNKAEKCKSPLLELIMFTSSSIPTTNRLAVYDLVVVMLDHTKQASLEILKQLKYVRKNFVLGQVCYVFIGDKQRCNREFHFDSYVDNVQHYAAPTFYFAKESSSEWTILAQSVFRFLLKSIGVDTGYVTFPSSIQFVQSPIQYNLFS